jgi:hypothetical protein
LMGLGGLALSGMKGTGAVWLAIASFTLFHVLVQFGQTAWWPLLHDNTAGDKVGEFFARMRSRLRLTQVLGPLAVGWYLGTRPQDAQFVTLFCLSGVMLLTSAWWVSHVPERPVEESPHSIFRQMRETLAVRSVRRLLVFTGAHFFVRSLIGPFAVAFYKARGVPPNVLVWLASAVALSDLAGLKTWGRLVDSRGARPALDWSYLGYIAGGVAWVALFAAGVPVIIAAFALSLFGGVLQSVNMMGRTRAVMDAVPLSCQTEAFPLLQCTMGVCGAMGGLLGGLCVGWLMERAFRPAGLDGVVLYFAMVELAGFLVWKMSRRLIPAGE